MEQRETANTQIKTLSSDLVHIGTIVDASFYALSVVWCFVWYLACYGDSNAVMLAAKPLPAMMLAVRACVLLWLRWNACSTVFPIEMATTIAFLFYSAGDLLMELDTQSSRLHYFTYYGPTIASQSLFYAGGYLSFLLAHISLVIGTFLPPCKGQGSICHIVRCRKHTSWAVALPLILLVAIMCLLLGVVAGHEPVMFASVYIGAELVATWALVTRYCFFPFETDWRQLIAVIGLYLFAFSDLIICLRGFVSTHHWIWGWFAWERTVYMVPYHMALLFVSFLIPITGS